MDVRLVRVDAMWDPLHSMDSFGLVTTMLRRPRSNKRASGTRAVPHDPLTHRTHADQRIRHQAVDSATSESRVHLEPRAALPRGTVSARMLTYSVASGVPE